MLLEQVLEPSLMFFDPQKRLFWGSLLGSLLLIVFLSGPKRTDQIRILCSKKIWFHPSSRIDMKVIAINALIRALLLPPSVLTFASIAAIISWSLTVLIGEKPELNWSPLWITLLYSLTLFLADDFARFYFHRLQHRWRWLWVFHQVHHSALVLTPLTLLRTHPVDMLWARLRNALSYGIVTGIFYFCFGSSLSAWDILGAEATGFLFNLAGSNLRHSQVWIHFGPLEPYVLSPAAHQIHHSSDPSHYDRNFGVCLSIWDRLWNSHYDPRQQKATLHFGLGDSPLCEGQQKIWKLYLLPFCHFKFGPRRSAI